MIFRGLTASGDWTFGAGIANYAINQQAIELNIGTFLREWLGECFFALQDGIDWRNLLDVGQETNIEDAVRTAILKRFGVIGINSLTVLFDTARRFLTATYSIQTIYSQSFQDTIQISAGTANG